MATLDIFNGDAFGLSALTKIIIDVPSVPTKIASLGLFTESGIATTTMMIERMGQSINLVPNSARGAPGQPGSRTGRKLIPVVAAHLPQVDSVAADEIQNIRAFGSESEFDAISTILARRLGNMKANIDLTMEYQRMGAIKGQVLDADGSTVLLDMYAAFGMTQVRQAWNFATPSTNVDLKMLSVTLKRNIQAKLGGRVFDGVTVLCSPEFFDAFIAHISVTKAFVNWNSQFLQVSQADAPDFQWAGVSYIVYHNTSDSHFIPAGEAYAFPTGVPDLFSTTFAPADYMETVNTNGLPYYAKQMLLDWNKGIALESQSNPINLCKLPEAVFHLTSASV